MLPYPNWCFQPKSNEQQQNNQWLYHPNSNSMIQMASRATLSFPNPTYKWNEICASADLNWCLLLFCLIVHNALHKDLFCSGLFRSLSLYLKHCGLYLYHCLWYPVSVITVAERWKYKKKTNAMAGAIMTDWMETIQIIVGSNILWQIEENKNML